MDDSSLIRTVLIIAVLTLALNVYSLTILPGSSPGSAPDNSAGIVKCDDPLDPWCGLPPVHACTMCTAMVKILEARGSQESTITDAEQAAIITAFKGTCEKYHGFEADSCNGMAEFDGPLMIEWWYAGRPSNQLCKDVGRCVDPTARPSSNAT